jgi:hypothetical protein
LLHCYETPKNAIKKNRAKQPRETKKKKQRKNGLFRVFEPPLSRNAQKRDKKSIKINENKIKQVTTFVLGAAANVRHFHQLFSTPPLVPQPRRARGGHKSRLPSPFCF